MTDEVRVRLRLRRVDLDREQVTSDGSDVYNATQRAGKAAVKYVREELERYDATDSGTLYDAIEYRIHQAGDNIIADVGPFGEGGRALRYAKYVHDGTRSPIPAAGPKRMPVRIKGVGLMFFNRVRGQEAKPYISNALKKVREEDWYE